LKAKEGLANGQSRLEDEMGDRSEQKTIHSKTKEETLPKITISSYDSRTIQLAVE
jgi:hypothetical protein